MNPENNTQPDQSMDQSVQLDQSTVTSSQQSIQSQSPRSTRQQYQVKKVLLVLLVFLLIVVGGATAYFLSLSKDTIDTTQSSAGLSPGQSLDLQEAPNEMKKTTVVAGTVSVTLEHPVRWKVKEVSGGLPKTFITSPSGNTLMMQVNQELPITTGGCQSEYTIILEKRIPTKSENVYFAQYRIGDRERPLFTIEELLVSGKSYGQYVNTFDASVLEQYRSLKEGESIYSCGSPSIIGSLGRSKDTINFAILDDEEDIYKYPNIDREEHDRIYDQAKDDVEFMTMLQSLELSINE